MLTYTYTQVKHIEKIEEWELANIRLRSHHLRILPHRHLNPHLFQIPDKEYVAQCDAEVKRMKGYENFSAIGIIYHASFSVRLFQTA